MIRQLAGLLVVMTATLGAASCASVETVQPKAQVRIVPGGGVQPIGGPAASPDAAASRPRTAARVERGKATWYGKDFAGRTTASGEIYDPAKLTAAHPTLAFGTVVRVTEVTSGKSVTVRVNDRFRPFQGRIIDLSEAAFTRLAPTARGVIDVTVEPVAPSR